MSIYASGLWFKDIDRVINGIPCIAGLSGKKILITGISGLIGSALADILIRCNEIRGADIEIYAAARSEEKLKNRFGEYAGKDYFHFIHYDALEPDFEIPEDLDFIIHGAGNSSPDRIVKSPVETMLCNITGLNSLLKYSSRHNISRLLFISSSEVYGQKKDMTPFQDDQYGFVDILSPRNSYSVSKRAAETLCISYFFEYGLETVIARPGHIYGPTSAEDDGHISSIWSYAAAEGKEIVMKSDGKQMRSYVYCPDCASAILTILIKGEGGKAYNISNPDSIVSIGELAEQISKAAGTKVRTELPSEEERNGFNPMDNSSLNSRSLLDLGWKGCFNAEEGLAHTVEIIRSFGKRKPELNS